MKKNWLVSFFLVICLSSFSYAAFRHYNFPDPPFVTSPLRAYQIIDTVYPSSVATGESEVITVLGRDIQSGATFEVIPGAGLTLSDVQIIPTTKATFRISVEATAQTGLRNLKIYNPPPGGTFEAYGALVITQPGVNPSNIMISPGSSTAGTSLVATIEGANFDSNAQVAFARDITVTSIEVKSTTEIKIEITIASGAAAGAVRFTVRNPDSGGVGKGFFTIDAPAEGFTVTGIWPRLPNNEFPVESTISPFIITGTGISSTVEVTFDDANITYDRTKMKVDTAGKWIRIETLTIGKDTTLRDINIIVTNNPNQATAATAKTLITISAQTAFLESIANLAPRNFYLGRSYYNPEKQTVATYTFQVLREVPRLKVCVVDSKGIIKQTDVLNVKPSSTFMVRGAGTSDVLSLSVSASGTATANISLTNDLGHKFDNGVKFVWVIDMSTGQKIKAAMPIVNE